MILNISSPSCIMNAAGQVLLHPPGHFTTPDEGVMQTDSTNIEYRDVAGYIGYRVGDNGSVWSRRRRRHGGLGDKWKPLRACMTGRYMSVRLYKDGRGVTAKVHLLVMAAFRGPKPAGMQACHNNGDRRDNRLENLRYDTPASNQADRKSHGTYLVGERHPRSRFTNQERRSMYEARIGGEIYKNIAQRFSTSISTVQQIVNSVKNLPQT